MWRFIMKMYVKLAERNFTSGRDVYTMYNGLVGFIIQKLTGNVVVMNCRTGEREYYKPHRFGNTFMVA